jgi:hypothetical protein
MILGRNESKVIIPAMRISRNKKILDTILALLPIGILSIALFLPNCWAGEEKMADYPDWPLSIDGWTRDKENQVFDRETLYTHINGAAEVYLSYNFQRAFVRRFVKPGRPDIVAEVYTMGSSADAFGVFSLEQQDPEAGIGQGSEFGGSLLRFWKGRTFVSILGEGEGKDLEAAILDLGRALAANIKETGSLPEVMRYLPDLPGLPSRDKLCFVRSHILLNRCFFLSHANILQLGKDVETVLARYSHGANKICTIIVCYPSEAKADSAFSSFKSTFMPESGTNNLARLEDQTWTKAERYGKFIALVFGSLQAAQSEEIVRSIITRVREKGS